MQEFRTCPACGYRRGFHVFFRQAQAGVEIGLICPNCGQSHDLGWVSGEVPGTDPLPPRVLADEQG